MTHVPDVELDSIRDNIVDVPDFPRPGIVFRDVAPMLARPGLLAAAVRRILRPWGGDYDSVAGVESRGFIFAAAAAESRHCGLHLLRKPGKLPPPVVSRSYSLEYGSDRLEVRDGIIRPGEKVLLVDDVLATGGTAVAGVELLRSVGADVVGAAFLVELTALGGRAVLGGLGVSVTSLLEY